MVVRIYRSVDKIENPYVLLTSRGLSKRRLNRHHKQLSLSSNRFLVIPFQQDRSEELTGVTGTATYGHLQCQ